MRTAAPTTSENVPASGSTSRLARTRTRGGVRRPGESHRDRLLPSLLTPDEVAALLRTSKKAIYAMIERAQLPGVVRLGRRVLVREADLLEWLRQNTHAIAGKE